MSNTNQDIKKCIDSIDELIKQQSDANVSEVQRQLQNLSSTSDVVVFDPSSTLAIQFYVKLHELLIGLDPQSPLLCVAITILQKACKNSYAKSALIHTYKFVPVLSKFLSINQVCGNQLKLLQLLTELTHGVKITWQEAYLSYLTSTLVHLILNGDYNDKPYALEVLVNLCYKNLPVLYVLTRKVEITKFIKSIAKLNENPVMRMQVCKMLIILQQLKGDLPDANILNFVDVTFNTVADAYGRLDFNLLRTTVEFFNDVKGNDHWSNVIAQHPKCCEDAKRVLDFVDNDNSDGHTECKALLLEFIPSVLSINIQKTSKLLPRSLDIAVRFLHNEETVVASLNIIKMATGMLTSPHCPNKDSIIEKLLLRFPIYITLLEATAAESSREKKKALSILVGLLGTMATVEELQTHLVKYISPNLVQNIFHALFKAQTIYCEPLQEADGSEICIRLMALVSRLSALQEDWRALYLQLLNRKQVLLTLAKSFFEGDKIIKNEILLLIATPGWDQESLAALSEAMNEIRPSNLDQANLGKASTAGQAEYAFFSCNQESRLTEILDALHVERDGGRLGDTSTSAVMELYDCKLASMGHAERRVQAALEAADLSCSRLNHQVAELRGEVSHLLQMLMSAQQSVEGVTLEKNNLMQKLNTASDLIGLEKNQIKKLKAQTQQLEKVIQARDAEITAVMALKEEVTSECENVKKELFELDSKYKDLEKKNAGTEGALSNALAQIKDREDQISNLQANSQQLEKALTDSKERNKQKEAEIADCNVRIDELETIRKIVLNVATRNKGDSTAAE